MNIKLALLLCLLLGISLTANAADVGLAWDQPSSATNLSGYKVYYGTASGIYGTPITIGNQTTYTVSGLTAGTFYFAVTAYDTSGNESTYSNEVSTTINATTPPLAPTGITATGSMK